MARVEDTIGQITVLGNLQTVARRLVKVMNADQKAQALDILIDGANQRTIAKMLASAGEA
jgi:hypothetical protein